jgi:hypothetical protein
MVNIHTFRNRRSRIAEQMNDKGEQDDPPERLQGAQHHDHRHTGNPDHHSRHSGQDPISRCTAEYEYLNQEKEQQDDLDPRVQPVKGRVPREILSNGNVT